MIISPLLPICKCKVCFLMRPLWVTINFHYSLHLNCKIKWPIFLLPTLASLSTTIDTYSIVYGAVNLLTIPVYCVPPINCKLVPWSKWSFTWSLVSSKWTLHFWLHFLHIWSLSRESLSHSTSLCIYLNSKLSPTLSVFWVALLDTLFN